MEDLTYDQALAELQQIVNDLQEDNTGIDQLEEKAERAAELIRFCREKLRRTEEVVGGLFDGEEGAAE